MSLHFLGAETPKAILIRPRDLRRVEREQGGWKGAVASALVPKLTDAKALGTMAQELQRGLAAKGVDTDVIVIEDTGQVPAAVGRDVFTGMALGAGGVGALWLVYKLALKPLIGRLFG